MQFALPQFTDVEDKLIGPLTLKQFLSLLATGGVVMFFWSIFKFNIFFFVFALPIGILGIAITFAKFNGRQLFSYVFPFLSFMSRPKTRVYQREIPTMNFSKIEKKSDILKIKDPKDQQSADSRLKKLAYLLDEKASEEKELLKQS